MLIIKNGKVLLDGEDITNKPIYNYIGLSHNGSVLLKPSAFENRSEWTCIVPEVDDDRVYYRVYWKDREIAYCSSRKEAEEVLAMREQVEYDLEEAAMDMEWELEF